MDKNKQNTQRMSESKKKKKKSLRRQVQFEHHCKNTERPDKDIQAQYTHRLTSGF